MLIVDEPECATSMERVSTEEQLDKKFVKMVMEIEKRCATNH
jgi:hypothetical protein